jgi:hypothetical protein
VRQAVVECPRRVAAHPGGVRAEFAAANPEVLVELVTTGRYADLVEGLAAARQWHRRTSRADLARHDCLNYARFWMGDDWQFEVEGGGGLERVRTAGWFRASSVLALRAAVLGCHSVVLLPRLARRPPSFGVLDNGSRQTRPDQAFLALPASHPHQDVGHPKPARAAFPGLIPVPDLRAESL